MRKHTYIYMVNRNTFYSYFLFRNGIRMELIVMYLRIYRIQLKLDGCKYPFTGSANASTVNSY